MPDPAFQSRVSLVPVVAGLVLVVALLFWKVVLRGEVPVPADILFGALPWAAAVPEGFRGIRNELLSDVSNQMFPWHVYVWERLRAGQFPLWNPLNFGGAPLFANGQSAVLYPLNLLSALLPKYFGWSLLVPAKLVLAGAGMALFLRRFELPRVAIWVGAVSYALSGFMVVWLGWPHTNVALLLPWLFWTSQGLLNTRQRRWIAAQAAIVACAILGGHSPTTAHAIYANGGYVVLRTLLDLGRSQALRPGLVGLARYTAAMACGFALGAVQLLPHLEMISHSAIAQERGHGAISGLPKWTALCWFAPNIVGNPAQHNYLYNVGFNFNEQSGYAGVLALALAAWAWVAPSRRKVATAIGLVGLLAIGLAYALPGLKYLAYLPGLRYVANGRIVFVASFSLAALAALAVAALAEERRRAGPAAAILGAATLLAAAGAWVVAPQAHPKLLAFWSLPAHAAWIIGPVVAVALLALGLWAYWAGLLPGRAAGTLLAVVVGADMLAFAWGYNPTVPPAELYPSNPPIAELAKHPREARIFATGLALTPDTNLLYGLGDLRGYDGIFEKRLREYFLAIDPESANPSHGLYLVADAPRLPLLAVAGVDRILAPAPHWRCPEEPGGPGCRQIWSDGRSAIWELAPVRPAAYFAESVDVVSPGQALDRIRDPRWAVGRGAVIEEPVSVNANESEPAAPALTRISPEHMYLDLAISRSRLLVINEAWDPGWKARIDGQDVPLLRANHLFQAVVVPAGEHRVELAYEPRSIRIGGLISAVAAIVLGLLAIVRGAGVPLAPR